jgi:hypothetical protein
MRRAQLPAQPAQLDYYGGLKPTGVIGGEQFQTHDASATWNDGGRAAQLAAELTAALKTYGAEQARDAVLDYASDAWADGAMIDGKVAIVVDQSNEAAQFRVHWDLETLLKTIINDALDKGGNDIIEDIHRVCESTALMLNTMMQPEPEPAPPPMPQRAGRIAGRVSAQQVAPVSSRNAAAMNGMAVPTVRRTPRG